MKKNMRATDTLIRWGGDEFVGVYDAVSKDGLYLLAEKVFESFEDLSISSKGKIVNATVSIGFTHFKPQDKSFKDAIKRADNGLYHSKSGGRNQFSILDE
jgi:diguanylate cyclase (GGDEF)-like protein